MRESCSGRWREWPEPGPGSGAQAGAAPGLLPTIHGVTREVSLKVETAGVGARDLCGNLRRGALATATLNRKDFGLTWNAVLETGGMLVGEELKVTIDDPAGAFR